MPDLELLSALTDFFQEYNASLEFNISAYSDLDLQLLLHDIVVLNGSEFDADHRAPVVFDFSVSYRIIATVLHAAIFVIGFLGNTALVITASRSRSLHTPTYTYLVSLAFADLLLLSTAVPEAIVNHHVGKRWIFGSVGCAIFVFLNFLGINVGSITIMTFAFEPYIAVCRPLLSYRSCTVKRTKKIIFFAWLLVLVYCCPWLALTELKLDANGQQQCTFLMSWDQYSAFFIADFLVFYLLPLLTALFCYASVVFTVQEQQKALEASRRRSSDFDLEKRNLRPRQRCSSVVSRRGLSVRESNGSVNRMLAAVVGLFAVSWLPFRLLLIYNSFVSRPWLNEWFLLFAKTLIYFNSAINPVMYNVTSRRFRQALRATVTELCGTDMVPRMAAFQPKRSRPHKSGIQPGKQQSKLQRGNVVVRDGKTSTAAL